LGLHHIAAEDFRNRSGITEERDELLYRLSEGKARVLAGGWGSVNVEADPCSEETTMSRILKRRHVVQLALSASAAALSLPAAAHHGWSWAEDEQSTLTGTVQTISMAPPHPSMQVKAGDVVWLVDLGNPNQTERSGFTAASAKAGDAIVVLGNRHKDKSKMHMKAVRITIAGRSFDMYPERIRTN
jgi:hypothetical protein